MVRLLVQSTGIFWFSWSKQDCRQQALVLGHRSKAGRFVGDSAAGPLRTHRTSRETRHPHRLSGFKWPTQLFLSSGTNPLGLLFVFFFFQINSTLFCLRCFTCFPYRSTHFITTLEAALGCTASSTSTAVFSIHQHRPGLTWQSHLHFTLPFTSLYIILGQRTEKAALPLSGMLSQ